MDIKKESLILILCLFLIGITTPQLNAVAIKGGTGLPFGNYIELEYPFGIGQAAVLSSHSYSGSYLSSNETIDISGLNLGFRQYLPSFYILPKPAVSIGVMQRNIKVKSQASSIVDAKADGVLFYGELSGEYHLMGFLFGTSVGLAYGSISLELTNINTPVQYTPNQLWPYINIFVGYRF